MSQKRPTEEAASTDDKRRRFPNLKSVIMEVMRTQSIQWLGQMLEPSIRKVVKEEVEHALVKHFTPIKRSCGKEGHPSRARYLQLQFINSISPPVFTGAQVEGVGNHNIKVALVDGVTGKIVNSGPESSAKVEIVVLEGDFGGDEENNWTHRDFQNNIVRERLGKKPLLSGDLILKLKDGTAVVDEITFSDNSSWTRSRRFRLGIRVIDDFDGVKIKEAKTEPFIVKDHRGELYKKHHPPSLLDEVWRLEKIGKDGAFHRRLTQANIKSVKDFLVRLFIDPSNLRDILGPGMSSKMWEVTEEHAKTCAPDKTLYLYCPCSSQLRSGVIFDIMGQIAGLLSDGQYTPISGVPETEKAIAQEWLASASQHWEEVRSFDSEASLVAYFSRMNSSLCRQSSPRTENSSPSSLMASNRLAFDYREPSVSSTDYFTDMRGFNDYSFDFDQTLAFPSQACSSVLNCDSVSLNHDFSNEEDLRFFDPQTDPQSNNNSFTIKHSFDANSRAQRRWRKLFNVFKWISVRNLVVSRNKLDRDASVPVTS
ncbi:hypothetical protein SAY86_004216 [Trapa natans]|uniref:Calmodulin-binding protein n=1 Tax=Trapa natans TaxID=22666 RepID=A0AAN7MF97_TRANT|nr:hypothetical protein SAY86_004216 [Trapa natans]